jgi:hypothetical protein
MIDCVTDFYGFHHDKTIVDVEYFWVSIDASQTVQIRSNGAAYS